MADDEENELLLPPTDDQDGEKLSSTTSPDVTNEPVHADLVVEDRVDQGTKREIPPNNPDPTATSSTDPTATSSTDAPATSSTDAPVTSSTDPIATSNPDPIATSNPEPADLTHVGNKPDVVQKEGEETIVTSLENDRSDVNADTQPQGTSGAENTAELEAQSDNVVNTATDDATDNRTDSVRIRIPSVENDDTQPLLGESDRSKSGGSRKVDNCKQYGQSEITKLLHTSFSERPSCYGGTSTVDVQVLPVRDLGCIQSTPVKKRVGKRCKNPNHRHMNLTSHHGPKDPRNFLSCDYESLDYDTIENDLILQNETKREYKRFTSMSFNRWLVCFIIGVLTACIAVVVDIGIEELSGIKLDLIRTYMLQCLNKTTCSVLIPWLVWAGLNSAFVLVASVLTAFVEPVAAGSGIPEIKCYLNGVKVPRVVRVKTLVCKVAGIIAAVSGGLACGKEGPMVHSGAVVAAGVSQGRSTTFGCDCKLFKDFRCDHVKRDFIACGAAAGVSAAFGAPIGGVLFALEEGASFWNQSLTWRIFFSSLVSSFTLNTILSAYKGAPGDLSNPGLANFGLFEISNYEWFELIIFILMGAAGGLLGALFNGLNIKLTLFRLRHLNHPVLKVLEVMLVALTTTAVGFCAMYFVEDCTYAQVTDNTTELYNLQMQCDSGQYNSMATLFLQSPEATVKKLLHSPMYQYQWISLLTFAIIYFLMSVWTYGLAVPSGLFMPSLLTGAAYGRLIGVLLNMMAPKRVSPPGIYALIGAASFLGGVTRMTISLTVIIMEATRNITFGLPIMMTLVTARFVGNYFNEGLYDEHINLKQVPMLPWDPPVKSFRLTAGNIKSTPVKCLRAIESVGYILKLLRDTVHNGYPVVDHVPSDPKVKHFGQFMGLITREQLIILLDKGVYYNERTLEHFGDVSIDDFRDLYPRYPTVQELKVPEEHYSMKMDLRQFLNLSPYTCTESVSFARIFNLFRSMGLRHLVITNENNKVVGIVTRKDLAKFRKWRKQGSSGVQQLSFVGRDVSQMYQDCCE